MAILKCDTCSRKDPATQAQKYQQQLYGNRRVHNPNKDFTEFRCTCCESKRKFKQEKGKRR